MMFRLDSVEATNVTCYNIYINLLELFDVVSKIAKILQFYLFFVDLVTRRMMYER